MSNTFVLWDCKKPPPDNLKIVYCWDGYAEDKSVHSLLQYVENNAERLRNKYLSWVCDVGECRIGEKRLIDHLAFGDGFSYWWMTLFVEKSPWKSPGIIDALRLFALEEILVQSKPGKLQLVSTNRKLHRVIRDLCQRREIAYVWRRAAGKPLRRLNARYFFGLMPEPIQGSVSLVRLLCARWPFRKSDKKGLFSGNESLFFCSYFFNINPEQAKGGDFNSRYWGELHSLMRQFGITENWLQLYYPHDAVPNAEVAMNLVRCFNQKPSKQEFHTFLDAYLSWSVVFRLIKRWFGLVLASWRLRKIKDAFYLKGSQVCLWLHLRSDWYDSMRGSAAVNNLLWIELFDMALRDIPRQKMGLYLCENQAWERAFIHAWRKYEHGRLVAVAHSTVRFWDLRYFADPRTIRSLDSYPMPQADLIALNGKAAIAACLAGGYPKEKIVECEALRYGYLNDLQIRHPLTNERRDTIRVIILGDYILSDTEKMLRLMEAAAHYMSESIDCTLKPHPNTQVDAADYPSLNLKVVNNPLGAILHNFDVAYSSNLTSAAVDAHLSGIPIVINLDEATLNFSPLRGRSGVRFIGSAVELANALQVASQGVGANIDTKEFFTLDPALPRWKQLLSSVIPT